MSNNTSAPNDLASTVARLMEDYELAEIILAMMNRAEWYGAEPWQLPEHRRSWLRTRNILRAVKDILDA